MVVGADAGHCFSSDFTGGDEGDDNPLGFVIVVEEDVKGDDGNFAVESVLEDVIEVGTEVLCVRVLLSSCFNLLVDSDLFL